MRFTIVTVALVAAACQPAPQVSQAPTAEPPAVAAQAPGAPKPDLDPRGVTAAQAALDHACDRRNTLPRARPAPEVEAIAATGRAEVREKSLRVGRFGYDAAALSDEQIGYAYRGRYAAAEVDIVSHDDADSVGWVLIDQGAGALVAGHLLIPSPDGKLWATAVDWAAPEGKIQIYMRGASAWKTTGEFAVAFACDLHWIDNTTLGYRTSADFKSAPGAEQRLEFSSLRVK